MLNAISVIGASWCTQAVLTVYGVAMALPSIMHLRQQLWHIVCIFVHWPRHEWDKRSGSDMCLAAYVSVKKNGAGCLTRACTSLYKWLLTAGALEWWRRVECGCLGCECAAMSFRNHAIYHTLLRSSVFHHFNVKWDAIMELWLSPDILFKFVQKQYECMLKVHFTLYFGLEINSIRAKYKKSSCWCTDLNSNIQMEIMLLVSDARYICFVFFCINFQMTKWWWSGQFLIRIFIQFMKNTSCVSAAQI